MFFKTVKVPKICLIIQLNLVFHFPFKITADGKANFCYQLTILETAWTDRRPDYAVNMTFAEDGTISSTSIVKREIVSPFASIALRRINDDGEERTLYNITARLCDFKNVIRKIPMFKALAQNSLKQSNYSFSCPMKPGVYVMASIHINSKNPLFYFLYQPKTSYSFDGGIFEELHNKSLRPLSTYKIKSKVVKKSCAA